MMMRVNTQRGYVMPGLGTIINTAAIVAGGLLGLLFKNLLTKSMEDTLLKASSVCVLFIGIGGAKEPTQEQKSEQPNQPEDASSASQEEKHAEN